MYRNKKTRRKISIKYKYGGNPSCSTPLEESDKCKWGATKRRCMRLAIDSTPKVNDGTQRSSKSTPLPKRIIMGDKEYPSIVDKIIAESPSPIYRVIPERAYPYTVESCPPNIYMTDYSSRGINTCIANPKTQWPCDCPPDWYHARIDGTFVCMNPLKVTPVYLKDKPATPPDKIRVTIYDDKNYRKINRVATLDKLTEKKDDYPEMDYIEYYEPTTARPEPEKKDKKDKDEDTDEDDVEPPAITSQPNIYQWSNDRMKQKYANLKKSVKNVMRPVMNSASKIKKNISKRISSIASSMSLEKIAAAAVTKRDIASSKLRQEGLLYERRKDMNIEETNVVSELVDKKMEPLSSWVNKQMNKFERKVDNMGINTDRCLYGINHSVITADIIVKLVLEIKSQDVDPSEYEKITRKIVDEYEDEHPYLYWTIVLYHRFYPYLMSNSFDDNYIKSLIKEFKNRYSSDETPIQSGGIRLGIKGGKLPSSASIRMAALKGDPNYDIFKIVFKKANETAPGSIPKKLLFLGNDLVISALNNDIQYLNLPFPPASSSIEIIKSYTIPRSLPRTARFNISADVEDVNKNCGIYEEFKDQGLKIIKASIPSNCFKGSKDPKCMTVLNDTFFNTIATDPKNVLCMDFWRLCIAYRIHFNYILNSKFAHEVSDRLLKRRINSLFVALTHYSSGEILNIERVAQPNRYQADGPS
jgi:hypothetical protein